MSPRQSLLSHPVPLDQAVRVIMTRAAGSMQAAANHIALLLGQEGRGPGQR